MRRSRRCSPTLAAILVTVAVAAAPHRAAAMPETAAVTVNGERIAEADVAAAGRGAAAGATRQQVLEGLIAEALLVQEARRRRVEESPTYKRALRRWREERAIGLIGVEELRRVAGRGRPVAYAEFYPRATEAFAALTEKEHVALDTAVRERISRLRDEARPSIDAQGLKKYMAMRDIPPETARTVIAAQTSWGTITLEDLLAEENQNLAHVAQTSEDVLKMWQQIAGELTARAHVLGTAVKAGYFAFAAVKEDDARAERRLIASVYLDEYLAGKLTVDARRQRIDREAAVWSGEYGLAVEIVRLPGATRLDAEMAQSGWRKDGTLPATAVREKLVLADAWTRFTPEEKKIVMEQPWNSDVPPLRSGNGYTLLRLEAKAPPAASPTLRALVEPPLSEEFKEALVRQLLAQAEIK